MVVYYEGKCGKQFQMPKQLLREQCGQIKVNNERAQNNGDLNMYLSTGNWATPISRDVVKRSRKAIEWTLP